MLCENETIIWRIKMEHFKLLKMTTAGVFTALICIATMVIRIPSLGGNGYVNIGDCVILLCSWLFGGIYGALAAGLGSALADLLSGYPAYVPGTFVIKFLMGLVAYFCYKAVVSNKLKWVGQIASGIIAEIIMVLGYLFYEAVILGYGVGAFPAIISNILQGVTNLVLAFIAIKVFQAIRIERLFAWKKEIE